MFLSVLGEAQLERVLASFKLAVFVGITNVPGHCQLNVMGL